MRQNTKTYQDERDVDRYVHKQLEKIGLLFKIDFNDQQNVSDSLKETLGGASKTGKKGTGRLDFAVEKYVKSFRVPVIIENKVGLRKLEAKNSNGTISMNTRDVQAYALNGAVSYARHMMRFNKYDGVVAVGVAGDASNNTKIVVTYIYSSEAEPKIMTKYTSLSFLESSDSFDAFIKDAILTEEEKHNILIQSQSELLEIANKLNKLMNNHAITAAERVVYVSGMLLSMQDATDKDGNVIVRGLKPAELESLPANNERDSVKIVNKIEAYLAGKGVPDEKRALMNSTFGAISRDPDRDTPIKSDKLVSKSISEASLTRQIFQYVYDNVFVKIEDVAGHLDILGEMYSVFLKYALGDGKGLGIVLTPPYVTKLMAQILEVNEKSKVLDTATGSAGFLITCMEIMIDKVNAKHGKDTTEAKREIKDIKENRLMGVEINAQMYTLAATNMILRGDGNAKIEKGSSFDKPENLYKDFGATVLLLNPPFSYKENGMPFLKFGLENMQKHGKAAIIVQDSAGSGQAETTNKAILEKNRMLASIKMPVDLFMPYAGVQTSIYVFESGVPHRYDRDLVKFIDFRNDGYKRTKRGTSEVDNPQERYADMPLLYSLGDKADKHEKFHKKLWDLQKNCIEAFISASGKDWNYESHMEIDILPMEADFKKVVSDYMTWEVGRLTKGGAI